jgi:hypothetical protein
MFKNLTPLHATVHRDVKVKPINGFAFAKQLHIAGVMAHEFVRASATYPLVFIEDKDEFRPVAMLGLEQADNVFVDEAGQWHATYIPAIVRRYPFALATSETEGQFTVCLDGDSDLISTTDGEPLFDTAGEPTAIVDNIKRYLGELQDMEVRTKAFCAYLSENNMLVPFNVQVRVNDEMRTIKGCYGINEERLNNLSDAAFLTLRQRGYLAPIYAQLASAAQIERLVQLKSGRTKVSGVADVGGDDALSAHDQSKSYPLF